MVLTLFSMYQATRYSGVFTQPGFCSVDNATQRAPHPVEHLRQELSRVLGLAQLFFCSFLTPVGAVLSEQAQWIDHQVTREEQVELAEPEELAAMAPHGSLGGKTVQGALQEPSRADVRAVPCSCCEG